MNRTGARWRQVRVAGHFGELLQGRHGGQVVLVTLPCPALAVTARWRPGPKPFSLRQHPGMIPRARLRALWRAIHGAPPSGMLRLVADMPPGAGAGASTAAIVAVARALGASDPAELARLCLRHEGASDPLMLPDPGRALWASRAGVVMEWGAPLPGFQVVGGYSGPPVYTDPDDLDFADVGDLVRDWRRAAGDVARLAAIATESARRNLRHRGGQALAPVEDAMRDTKALGIVAAHTGSARGLLFAPGTAPAGCEAALAAAGLTGVFGFRTGAGA